MDARFLVIAALLLTPTYAFASGSHDNGPNGGTVADAGSYHVELVVKSNTVVLFVSDKKDKPVATAGFKAIVIFNVDGKAQRIPLEPSGEAKLSGTTATPLPAQPKGVVQLTAPDGKTAQAKFQ